MKATYVVATAFLVTALSLPVNAQDQCSITIDTDDALRYSTNAIDISKSCDEFTIKLTHGGQQPKNIVGHNWVLTKADDLQAVATEGMSAGLDQNYVKPNDDRVIAFTPVIGAGEETSVTFPVSKLSDDQEYKFFCSFPGHWAVMQGSVNLVQ